MLEISLPIHMLCEIVGIYTLNNWKLGMKVFFFFFFFFFFLENRWEDKVNLNASLE